MGGFFYHWKLVGQKTESKANVEISIDDKYVFGVHKAATIKHTFDTTYNGVPLRITMVVDINDTVIKEMGVALGAKEFDRKQSWIHEVDLK